MPGRQGGGAAAMRLCGYCAVQPRSAAEERSRGVSWECMYPLLAHHTRAWAARRCCSSNRASLQEWCLVPFACATFAGRQGRQGQVHAVRDCRHGECRLERRTAALSGGGGGSGGGGALPAAARRTRWTLAAAAAGGGRTVGGEGAARRGRARRGCWRRKRAPGRHQQHAACVRLRNGARGRVRGELNSVLQRAAHGPAAGTVLPSGAIAGACNARLSAPVRTEGSAAGLLGGRRRGSVSGG